MRGRLVLCSVLLGHAVVVFSPQQHHPSVMAGAALGGLLGLCWVLRCLTPQSWRHALTTLMWVLLCASLAALATTQRVAWRLSDALAPNDVDRVSRVVLRVAELPQHLPNGRRFRAQVLSSEPAGIPRDIAVSWFAPGKHSVYADIPAWPFAELVPGQVWRMALTMRPPKGERNPHGFDFEGHLFAQGVRATGSVRGTPILLRDEPWANFSVTAQRLRHHVRAAMQPYVAQTRYGAVLIALAIGDQAGVAAEDWKVFNRSGITHLVSISGSHITMIAALGGLSVVFLWKRGRWRGRWLAERLPAPLAGAWVALGIAWLYCLLAGWGIPAQRTFWMLAVLALAYTVRLPLAASTLLLWVACVVVLLDPWALLSSGFWLSFAAVIVLMASRVWEARHPIQAADTPNSSTTRTQRICKRLWAATRLQLTITAALLPFLARLFHEVSLVSPLANAYAIAVIGLIVTPLSLLLALFACVPGAALLAQGIAWLGHTVLAGMMLPTVWLSRLSFASLAVPAVPWALTLLAVCGIVVALWPGDPLHTARGKRAWQHLGWALLLPALCWRPARPAPGDWWLTVLDTGQSGAAVLQTQHYNLLFDTGLRTSPDAESGTRTIVPFLRSQNIQRLHAMVVSHADLDHVGGASGVLRALPVQHTFSSFDLRAWLHREARLLGTPQDVPPMPQESLPCHGGQHWEVDGVTFTFLWPDASAPPVKRAGNAHSCVLLVRGAHHAVLFTGDIGAAQEKALVAQGLSAVDVVLAPHHGSRFSSSGVFIQATQPAHVIAQAGLWNPFAHPHPHTMQRWQRAGARFWHTGAHGAIQVQSSHTTLDVSTTRTRWPRYWQLPCHVRHTCVQAPANQAQAVPETPPA